MDAEVQHTADQQTADRQTAVQQAADQQTAGQQTAGQQTAGQQTAEQQTAEQQTAEHGWRSWFGKNRGEDATSGDSLTYEGPPVDDEVKLDGDAADPGSAAAGGQPDLIDPSKRRQLALPLVSRPLINPRLTSDPRLRIWLIRIGVCLIAFAAVTMWKNWRYGLTAVVIVAAIDTLFRSRTTGITPTAVRVTAAQKATARRLKVLQAAGYMTLNTRKLPGTKSVVDHVVVGPSGIFTLDSQRFDTRLPLRAKGGVLYHGPVSQDAKFEHAKYEADKVAELIGAELGQRVRVRPVMVVYGPSIPWIIMRIKGVDTLDGSHVGAYFRRQSKATIGHHLDNAQVALVFSAAAHALPPLD